VMRMQQQSCLAAGTEEEVLKRPPNALVQLRAILLSSIQPNDLIAPVCCNVR